MAIPRDPPGFGLQTVTIAAALAVAVALPSTAHAMAGQAPANVGAGLATRIPPQSGRLIIRGEVLPDAAALAVHPQCFVAADRLIVRGAAYDADTGRLVAGAHVVLRNGGRYLEGDAGKDGVFTLNVPLTDARTVRVVQVTIPSPNGPQPVDTVPGAASCIAWPGSTRAGPHH